MTIADKVTELVLDADRPEQAAVAVAVETGAAWSDRVRFAIGTASGNTFAGTLSAEEARKMGTALVQHAMRLEPLR